MLLHATVYIKIEIPHRSVHSPSILPHRRYSRNETRLDGWLSQCFSVSSPLSHHTRSVLWKRANANSFTLKSASALSMTISLSDDLATDFSHDLITVWFVSQHSNVDNPTASFRHSNGELQFGVPSPLLTRSAGLTCSPPLVVRNALNIS